MQKTREHEDILTDPDKLRHRIQTLERDLEEALEQIDALRQHEISPPNSFDSLPFGALNLDSAGLVISVNRRFCEISGQDPESLLGTRGLSEVGCLKGGDLEQAVEKLLAEGHSFDLDLSPLNACAGVEGCLSVHGHALEGLEGDGMGYLLLLEETTSEDESGDRLKSSLSSMRRIILGAVEAMSLMVERRDPFVAGHQRRVAKLAAAIAGELGLDAFEVEGIRIAALLHDVGKVAIPSEILCKPASLSGAEERIVRTHPFVAQSILKRIPFPWSIAEVVLQHAERLDGSGYPQGLKGDEIGFQARIVAVADTVEAMLTYRPYRPAQDVNVVMAVMKENRNHRYDPRVVDACLRLFCEKGFELKEK